MTLAERLQEMVELRFGGNWAELARTMGVAPSTLHPIKQGSDPRASTLLRIADALNTSLDWLVRGTGRKCLEQESVEKELNPAPADEVARQLREEERHQEAGLGLGSIAVLGRKGAALGPWMVLSILEHHYPDSLTFDELLAKVREQRHVDVDDLVSDLALLTKQGTVKVGSNGVRTYGASKPIAVITSQSIPDVSQHTSEIVRQIIHEIMPVVETDRSRGALLSGRVTVEPGCGQGVVREIIELTRGVIDRATQCGTPDDGHPREQLSIVVGVALQRDGLDLGNEKGKLR